MAKQDHAQARNVTEAALSKIYRSGGHITLCTPDKNPRGAGNVAKGWHLPENRPRLDEVLSHAATGGLIGIIPASVGLIGIDIDRDVGDSLAAIEGEFGPPVAMQRTPSGGAHMFYPKADCHVGSSQWGESVEDPGKQRGELRQDTGQICIYDVGALANALPVTGKAFEINRFRVTFARRSVKAEKPDASMTKGNRNNALFKKAIRAWKSGDVTNVEKVKAEAIKAGLQETEADATIQSARETVAKGLDSNGELDIAEAMARAHGIRFAYGSDLGWHIWTGTHWTREGARDAARRAIIETIKGRKSTDADAGKMRRNGFIGGATELAALLDPVYRLPAEWNRKHPTLFNCLNGTLDLETGKLRPHDPNDLFLGVANVEWKEREELDEDAYKVWLDYIRQVVPDEAERKMLQAFLGYCLTGWIMDHHLLMIIGGAGAGKSTLINAISGVMGSLACHFQADILMKRNVTPHKQEWMQFRGRRVGFAAEIRKGASLDTSVVNLLTGDDVISGNYMRQNTVTYPRTHKTIIFGNHRPNLGDTTGDGITRRLALLEVTSIAEAERDPLLGRRLADPKVRSCILHWMAAGLRFFIQDGHRLILPESVKARNREAFEADDPLAGFLDELNVIEDPNGFIPSADLYGLYKDHCDKAGCRRISQKALVDKLHRRGWPKPTQRRAGSARQRGFEGRCLG